MADSSVAAPRSRRPRGPRQGRGSQPGPALASAAGAAAAAHPARRLAAGRPAGSAALPAGVLAPTIWLLERLDRIEAVLRRDGQAKVALVQRPGGDGDLVGDEDALHLLQGDAVLGHPRRVEHDVQDGRGAAGDLRRGDALDAEQRRDDLRRA